MEDIKTLLKEQEEGIKRHIDVLKEGFDSKVQLLIEQYESIIGRLDSHDKKFTSIEERLNFHNVRLAFIEAKLTSIEKDIEIMKVDISFIKNSLKKKVDLEEFEALERRVAILEAKSRSK